MTNAGKMQMVQELLDEGTITRAQAYKLLNVFDYYFYYADSILVEVLNEQI